jgi:hypothetical protein
MRNVVGLARTLTFGRIAQMPSRSVCCSLVFMMAGSVVAAEGVTRNDSAIAAVAAGTISEARASWWGFDARESTTILQEAINSRAKRLIVDKQSGPWIVDEIHLRSDLEILFEPGVEVLAKKDAFRGTGASLFTALDCDNLQLIGPGATLRMRRDDYARPPYQKAEWRHVLNLRGCSQVLVTGLTLAESGGDGIYVARSAKRKECRDITVRDVICDRNYRQGISVISAENLLIENSVLKGTGGTAPAAGIDFEPNRADERLVNCVLRNCRIEDNEGYAFHIYARQLDGSSADMSILVENCVTRGTNARSVSVVTSNGGTSGSVRGRIEFVDCQFLDAGHAGIVIGSKPIDGPRLSFRNCHVADASEAAETQPPVVFHSRAGDTVEVGGVEFQNLTVQLRGTQPVLRFDDRVGMALSNITGTINVQHGETTETVELNPETLDRLVPANSFVRVKAVELNAQHWAFPLPSKPLSKVPAHRLRDYATFWVFAQAQETVECQLRFQHVGKGAGEPMSVRVLDTQAKQIASCSVTLDDSRSITFVAQDTGAYQVACEPRNHTVQMLSCSHAFGLSGRGAVIHFVHTPGDVHFCVPAGTTRFAVRAQGEGEAERVGVSLFDANGRAVWTRPNLSGADHEIFNCPAASEPRIWRVRMDAAPAGVLEDHYLELRGVPPIVGLNRESVPVPAP